MLVQPFKCKKRTVFRPFIWLLYFLFTIVFLAVPAYSMPGAMLHEALLLEMTGDWYYRWEEPEHEFGGIPAGAFDNAQNIGWQKFNYPGKPSYKPGYKTVWIKTKLLGEILNDPSLFFKTEDAAFEVYMEGKLLYSFGEINSVSSKRPPGSPWHIIPLPRDYQGKNIIFRVSSILHKNLGVINKAAIACSSTHILNIVKDDIYNTVLGFLFIFIGICTIPYVIFRNKMQSTLIFLCFFSTSIGVWLISETGMKQLFINRPVFWMYVAFASSYMIPVFFFKAMEHIIIYKHIVIFKVLWKIYLFYAVAAFILDISNLTPIIYTLTPFFYLLIPSMGVACAVIIASAILGNTHARIFLWGFMVLVLTTVYDILGWHFKIVPWTNHVISWGMFAFLITLSFIMLRNIFEVKDKLDNYSKEIKIKNEKLSENIKLLDDALKYDRLKNEFLANVSHEFRTPLNILLGTLKLFDLYVRNGTLKSDTKNIGKHINAMQHNSYRLLKLVNNLIDITRIDSGFLSPTLKNCNIAAVVKAICLSTADYIESKGLSFCFYSDAKEIVTACDADKIERIMLNLLSNAVKFSKSGGNITVSMKSDGHWVSISVTDTGIGIPSDKLEHIFERFNQVDKSFTRNYEGSGIGLSLVRSLVEMHKGKVWVESEYGKGSKFYIKLPVVTIPEESAASNISANLERSHTEMINIEFSDIRLHAENKELIS